MPKAQLDASCFSPDTLDFLKALHQHGVHYMIVGGEAVIYYGYARLTGDIDFYYECTVDNTTRLYAALQDFWKGAVPGLAGAAELMQLGLIVQFGVPPHRIDLINRIDGVDFAEAWPNRLPVVVRGPTLELPIWYLGVQDLIRNKRATARPKDVDDLRFLEERPS